MRGRLHDGEGGVTGEAETLGVGVYFFREIGRPCFGVEGVKGFEKVPVVGILGLDGVRVRRALALDHERGVRR